MTPIPSKIYTPAVAAELAELFATCRITDMPRFEKSAAKCRYNRARYTRLGNRLGGIPWWFIACIHGMEASYSFERHLHNGDPLTARTRRVPSGRPVDGRPPFGWEESAIDALTMPGKKFDLVDDWSIGHALWLLESFNGHGYRLYRGIHSPYLWSGTNHYTRGKYIADGVWSPTTVSKQAGVAGLVKLLTSRVEP